MSDVIVTQGELQQLAGEWQATLGLRDWDVKVVVLRAREMMSQGTVAEINYHPNLRRATVNILDPIDQNEGLWERDMEADLVHELLHLHFWPYMDRDESSLLHTAQEATIDQLSRSLVALKRGK